MRTWADAQQNQSWFTIATCLNERQCAPLLRIRAYEPDYTGAALQETAISHAVGTGAKMPVNDEFCVKLRLFCVKRKNHAMISAPMANNCDDFDVGPMESFMPGGIAQAQPCGVRDGFRAATAGVLRRSKVACGVPGGQVRCAISRYS